MMIDYIGYNYWHDSIFFVSRPYGNGNSMLLLLKTPAVFTISGNEITAPENSFILYKEGTPQYYRACGEEFINDWFRFFSDDETNIFESMGIPFDTVVNIGDISPFSALIEIMSREFYSDSPYTQNHETGKFPIQH